MKHASGSQAEEHIKRQNTLRDATDEDITIIDHSAIDLGDSFTIYNMKKSLLSTLKNMQVLTPRMQISLSHR
jgi:uncharacterized protein YxjI